MADYEISPDGRFYWHQSENKWIPIALMPKNSPATIRDSEDTGNDTHNITNIPNDTTSNASTKAKTGKYSTANIQIGDVIDSVVQNTVNIEIVEENKEESLSVFKNIRFIKYMVVGIAIMLSIPLIMNFIDHEIVGEWENYAQYSDEDGENIYCRQKFHDDGEMTASCYTDPTKKWTWDVVDRTLEEHMTWMLSNTYIYSFEIVDDVMFKGYRHEKYNSENNCTASVKYGVINSEQQWKNLVISTKKPTFCDQIYGIDVSPPPQENSLGFSR